jgi:nicotinate phosphoribosyltransferase
MPYELLPYRHSLALFADLYQLTMGQVYHAEGMAEREAVFHHHYRAILAGGGYVVAAGLALALDYLRGLRFDEDDLDYLATIPGTDGRPLFRPEFLAYLRRFEFACDVDAVAEGTVIFPHEPLIRVRGPLLQAQLVETALLTLLNYSTAIATEAARICHAADGMPVLDFSARRAPGIDGSLTATRSAYIGGFAGTSSVWAARRLGLPASAVRGTMAHSLVMSFDSEPDAFAAYARTMPNNCLFLVDTYGTLEGVRNAIKAGQELRARGFDLLGVRLDSGDLAELSKRARRMLDAAGFSNAAIFATNDLNGQLIRSLRNQGATITIWGVGTKLMVSSLPGVYKLAALRDVNGEWQDKIKLSDQPARISIPGIQQVRRYRTAHANLADCIYDERAEPARSGVMISLKDHTQQMKLPTQAAAHDLLAPVMRQGRLISDLPSLEQIRDHCRHEMQFVTEATKRFENPDEYRVGLEKSLYERRDQLILAHRGVRELKDVA